MKVISTLPAILFFICLSIFSFQAYAEDPIIQQHQTLNINEANAQDISKALKGVGMKKANAIVAYRESYGDFHHIDELTAVKGIGKSTLAKNAHLISLE